MTAQPLLDLLARLEAELHHPGQACTPERLEQLLHPSFREVGRSGRPYTREQVAHYLATRPAAPRGEATAHHVQLLAPGLALLTYRSAEFAADDRRVNEALRSSVWIEAAAGWQLAYHQGTPAAEDGA